MAGSKYNKMAWKTVKDAIFSSINFMGNLLAVSKMFRVHRQPSLLREILLFPPTCKIKFA